VDQPDKEPGIYSFEIDCVKNRVAELMEEFPKHEKEIKNALRDTENMKP